MKPLSRATLFGLVRHARTEWNVVKRIQGVRDSPVTQKGAAEAEGWAIRLSKSNWDRIICSDLNRARATAEILNGRLNVPLEFDGRLREQDWGSWTGLTVAQIRREDPAEIKAQENAGWNFCPPEGESRRHVCARSMGALKEAGDRYPGERILVVTHEGVIKCLLNQLCGHSFGPETPLTIMPYHLHWLKFESGELSCEFINAQSL